MCVFSAVLAFANGKPWKVHKPSSARAAEHTNNSAAVAAETNRIMEKRSVKI
jgi:hypothetical protein